MTYPRIIYHQSHSSLSTMVQLLHTVQRPEGSGHCATYTDENGRKRLAISRGNSVQIYEFSPDLPGFLKNTDQESYSEPITTMVKARGVENDNLVVISGKKIHIYGNTGPLWLLNENTGLAGKNFLLSFIHGLKVALALINSEGRVYVATIGESKRFDISSLGCAHVTQAVELEKSDSMFAVLYSNYDLSYSLKYCELTQGRFVESRLQFEAFVEAPTLVVPMTYGGVMVLSNYRIYLFPSPEQTVYVSDSFEEQKGVPVSSARNVITIDIKLLPYLNSMFLSYTKIDLERYLLCTDTGLTAVAYIKTTFTATNVSLEAFSIYDIGNSTIALSMSHVTDNVFFAASQYSRSILFKVMPTEPHIRILSFVPSSPPVIDLDYSFSTNPLRYLPDIFVCQGGYHSGELRKIAHNSWKATQLSSVQIEEPFAEIVRLLDSRARDLDLATLVGVKVDQKIIQIFLASRKGLVNTGLQLPTNVIAASLNSTVSVNGKIKESDFATRSNEAGVIKFSKLTDNTFIYITTDHIVFELKNSNQSYPLQGPFDLVCTLDTIEFETSVIALVGYIDGVIEVFQFSEGNRKKRDADPLSKWTVTCGIKKEGLRDACFCVDGRGSIVIVALDGQGNVHQYLFDNGKVSASSVWICKGPGPTTMDSDGSMILLYDTHKVLGMVKWTMHFLELCDFFYSPHAIKSCTILLSYNKLVGVHLEGGKFVTVSHENRKDTIDAQFSGKLWTKVTSIPNTHYLVCVETDIRPRRGQSRVSTLNLIDGRTMRLLHTYSGESLQFADVCYVPENEEHGIGPHSFAAIQTNCDWRGRFPLFVIEEGKIKKVPNVSLDLHGELEQVSFSVLRYDFERECLHAAGEDLITLNFKKSDSALELKATGSIGRSCLLQHVTEMCPEPNGIVVLDSFRGLFHKTADDFAMVQELNVENVRLTALCVVPGHRNAQSSIIVGDSLGTVHLGDTSFLVYSQINVLRYVKEDGSVLIGTLNGGIYRLTRNAVLPNDSLKHPMFNSYTSDIAFKCELSVGDEDRVYLVQERKSSKKSGHLTKGAIVEAWVNSSDKGFKKQEEYSDSHTRDIAGFIDQL